MSIFRIQILVKLPVKKHVFSPNLGLYMAHLGAENSVTAVKRKTTKGAPYPNIISHLSLPPFWLLKTRL